MLYRFFSVLLCVILVGALAGCAAGGPAPPEEQPAYDPPQIVEEEPTTKFELFETEQEPEKPAEDEESYTVDKEDYVDKPVVNYSITIIDSSEIIFIETPRFDNVLTFPLIQVIHTNEILGEKINDSIIEASRWMSEVLHYIHFATVDIFLQSERYLSFVYGIHFQGGRADTLCYSITIDMQTGKRVILNNLVNTNLEFAKRVIDTSSFIYYEHIHNQGSLTPSWLLEHLTTSNFTAREIYEHPYLGRHRDIYSTLEPLMFRRIFFLKDDYIIIVSVRNGGTTLSDWQHLMIGWSHIKINLSDIQDFLLVDSW